MISYIEGKIILRRDKFIIVQAGGVGYQVFVSRKTLSKLPEVNDNINTSTPLSIKLFCYHNVTETASDLYGFMTAGELDFFEILMEIHGIGPKAALEISSLGSLDSLKDSILKQDMKIFAGIPGIGAKKASTIILELTGKIHLLDGQKKSSADPAEGALIQLGFSKQQAKDALGRVPAQVKDMEERVKAALKTLGR